MEHGTEQLAWSHHPGWPSRSPGNAAGAELQQLRGATQSSNPWLHRRALPALSKDSCGSAAGRRAPESCDSRAVRAQPQISRARTAPRSNCLSVVERRFIACHNNVVVRRFIACHNYETTGIRPGDPPLPERTLRIQSVHTIIHNMYMMCTLVQIVIFMTIQ